MIVAKIIRPSTETVLYVIIPEHIYDPYEATNWLIKEFDAQFIPIWYHDLTPEQAKTYIDLDIK
jgi:molybdopterin synthase catalytic subunit